jgi:D-arabinose 1-dehydrogenase-like Zn-dependent alcohol dehydrogenase
MRAIRLTSPGTFRLERIAVPEPGHGEVLVGVQVCGVCGSDVHLVDGATVADSPVVLGHEAAGTVLALGDGVTGLAVGTRVAVLPYIGCGGCPMCRRRQPQACPRRAVLGVDRDGAQADRIAVPVECLIPLPDCVPFEIGAILTDAVATPYHAIRRSGIEPGQTAVVFGLGGLGMHAVAILVQLLGCAVIGVDPRPEARTRASELGAAAVLDSRDADGIRAIARNGDGGVDAAFEFVGHPDVVGQALRCLRPQGSCVVVGIGSQRLALAMRQETLVGRELRLMGSFGCTAGELAELVDLVAGGRLTLHGSVTRLYPPEEFAAALAETRDKRAGSVRVAVSYGDSG